MTAIRRTLRAGGQFDVLMTRLWPALAPCLLLALIALAVQSGSLILQREMILALVYVVLVVGFYTFAGLSGILSFGHMSFMAIGAYVTALITIPVALKGSLLPDLPGFLANTEFGPLPAALIAGGAAMVFALALAAPLMRLTGIAAAVSMFAVLLIVHDVASNWEAVTRGRQTMLGVPTNTTMTVATIGAIVAIICAYAFQQSRIGLRLRAARDDEIMAQACGINLVTVRSAAFLLSAFLIGVGGFLYAQFIGSFTPESFYINITFLTIAMLVVGGRYSLAGAVIGTIAFSALSAGLLRIEEGAHIGPLFIEGRAGLREVGLALVVLLILSLRPNGIMGGREFGWPRRVRTESELEAATPLSSAAASPTAEAVADPSDSPPASRADTPSERPVDR